MSPAVNSSHRRGGSTFLSKSLRSAQRSGASRYRDLFGGNEAIQTMTDATSRCAGGRSASTFTTMRVGLDVASEIRLRKAARTVAEG